MGGARWVDFGSEDERLRVLTYLHDRALTYESRSQVWIEPIHRDYFLEDGEPVPFAVQIEYSFGSDQPGDLAILVIRELARRFNVVRIGSDAIGWYDDKDWSSDHPKGPVARYDAFPSWVEWAKVWRPDWSGYKTDYDDPNDAVDFARFLEQFVVEVFQNLDSKTAK